MLRLAEMALAAFAVVLLSGTNAYYYLIGVPPGITAEELVAFEGTIRNVFLVAYAIVAFLTVIHWQKMILGMAAVWPIVVLVGIAWLSTFWTVAPEITSRRCIALTITTLMGIYLFTRFDLRSLLQFLVCIVAILVVGCLIWVVFIPDYGLHADEAHAGVWRGIFFHKNTTGRVMVFSLAILCAAWIGSGINRAVLAVLGLLTALVALGTTSQTTLLGMVVLLGGLITVRMVRGQALRSAVISLVIITVAWHGAIIALTSYEMILEALGRDASLTGRTEIWAYTMQYVMKQPLTGYGYDAFWNGDYSPGANYASYWDTPHSHNGWIEVSIALGLPAALIMMATMIVTLLRGIVLARYSPDTTGATLIILTCFSMLTIAMSEPVFLEKHTFDWMLMVAVVGCARALTWSLAHEEPQLAIEERPPSGALSGYT